MTQAEKYDILIKTLENQKEDAIVTSQDMAFILKEIKPLLLPGTVVLEDKKK